MRLIPAWTSFVCVGVGCSKKGTFFDSGWEKGFVPSPLPPFWEFVRVAWAYICVFRVKLGSMRGLNKRILLCARQTVVLVQKAHITTIRFSLQDYKLLTRPTDATTAVEFLLIEGAWSNATRRSKAQQNEPGGHRWYPSAGTGAAINTITNTITMATTPSIPKDIPQATTMRKTITRK